MNTTPTPLYRQEVWDYLSQSPYRCLIDLADAQARASANQTGKANTACQLCAGAQCPQPINFLINATTHSAAPMGLAGTLPAAYRLVGSGTCLNQAPAGTQIFNGCNFGALQPLADAKNGTPLSNPASDQLRGFGLNHPLGLAILLGPWADYCLWCWSQHPNLGEGVSPILILGKDNSCFADEIFTAGRDWGAEQVHDTAQIAAAGDRSSQILFCAIQTAAVAANQSIEQFIAAKRILVCNIWPWFRCGQDSSGDGGVHPDFSQVPLVRQFAEDLVDCLKPRKIACLGGWSYRYDRPTPDDWMSTQMLNGCPAASQTPIEVFRHPSASQWPCVWKLEPGVWGGSPRWNGKTNKKAFVDFIF